MHQQIRHIPMPFGGAEIIYLDLVENKGIFFVVDLGFVFCQFRSFRFLQEKKIEFFQHIALQLQSILWILNPLFW